jgi:hypothetical protein
MARLDPGQHLVRGHRECRDLVAALRDRDLLGEVRGADFRDAGTDFVH